MNTYGYEVVTTGSNADFADISGKIMSVLDPEELAPAELWKRLEIVTKDEVISFIKHSGSSGFLVHLTEHPPRRSAVYRLSRAQAAALIADNFDEDSAEGLDIILCDDAYSTAFLGNHDGLLLERPK